MTLTKSNMSNILGSLSLVRNALEPLKLINDHVPLRIATRTKKIDYLLLLTRKSAILSIYLHTIRLIVRKRSIEHWFLRNAAFFIAIKAEESLVLATEQSLKSEGGDKRRPMGPLGYSTERTLMKTFWYEKWSAFQVLSKISKVVTSFILSFLDVKPYFLLVVNLILIWKLDYLFQNGSVSQF